MTPPFCLRRKGGVDQNGLAKKKVVDRVTVKVMFTPAKVSHAECVAATEWVHSTGLSDENGIEQEAV